MSKSFNCLGDVGRCLGKNTPSTGTDPSKETQIDFQLMSRVLIRRNRHEFEKPMRIIGEYDVPEDAWFWNSHPNGCHIRF